MKLVVGSRVLTPEGTGFVVNAGSVSLDVPSGSEEKLVGVETVTEVFGDADQVEEESPTTWMTPFQQQVEDATDLGFEKEVILVSRPTKAAHLRIIMELPEHEAALFFLPRTE